MLRRGKDRRKVKRQAVARLWEVQKLRERDTWIWAVGSHVVPWAGALPLEWGGWKPDDRR